MTQGPPDADSLALVEALLSGPLRAARTEAQLRTARVAVRFAQGLCRSLIGHELADQLELPRDGHRFVATGIRLTLQQLERMRARVPLLNHWVMQAGDRYWERSVRVGLGGEDAQYRMPDGLEGRPRTVP